MIEQEFVLLGLLKESPKHGYEIKRKIKEILSLFAGIEIKSIYYPLKILEKKGLIDKHTSKVGRRPQRNVYKLTSKGQARFKELLTKSFMDFKRPQFSLDLSLYFLKYIKQSEGKRRLRGRIFILNRIANGLKKLLNNNRVKLSKPSRLILEHNLELLQAETRFLDYFIKAV
ncbi:MAG: hypothetical protein DRP74_00765 [Candidatus Omnitrophota bacterium]|nr:MAG: hypothetical protein DRP74_00765 [Candidatus Omnitrophota bacterium]